MTTLTLEVTKGEALEEAITQAIFDNDMLHDGVEEVRLEFKEIPYCLESTITADDRSNINVDYDYGDMDIPVEFEYRLISVDWEYKAVVYELVEYDLKGA